MAKQMLSEELLNMPKLKDLILEMLFSYKVTAYIVTSSKVNITDILDMIRATKQITVVNTLPSDSLDKRNTSRNDEKEEHLIEIKFLSANPQSDLDMFKKSMTILDKEDTTKKIQGLQTIKFLQDTLTKI
jgi:Asp-tRNA(Asn)/Glu-tRNA(Gln) amidotransferase C subunit